ncbi:MAG: hypothetical protein ABEK50_11630 [bacterium]
MNQQTSPEELPERRERDQRFVATDEFVEQYMQIRKGNVRKDDREESPVSFGRLMKIIEEKIDHDRHILKKPTKKRDLNRHRAGLAYAARRYGHGSTAAIAEWLNVSDTTISRMVRKVNNEYENLKKKWDQWIQTGNRGV